LDQHGASMIPARARRIQLTHGYCALSIVRVVCKMSGILRFSRIQNFANIRRAGLLEVQMKLSALLVYQDMASGLQAAKQDLFSQGLFDLCLDQSSHRPGAKELVEPVLGKPRPPSSGQLDSNPLFHELRAQLGDEFVDYLFDYRKA